MTACSVQRSLSATVAQFFLKTLALAFTVASWLAICPSAAAQTVLYIPASAHAEGKNGTFFVTDARIFNPGATSLGVSLAFLVPNSDNRTAPEVTVQVSPRRSIALDDVVSRTLGAGGGGAIRMRSSGLFQGVSRTYNNANPAAGTFGLSIPGVQKNAALTLGVLPFLSNRPGTPGFRSNVGFVNPEDAPVSVTVKLLSDSTGVTLGQTVVDLQPQGFHQINDIFAQLGLGDSTENASLTFSASSPVFGFATVIDNISGDAIFLQGQADYSGVLTANQFVRASANAAGKNSTYFVTDLRIFNPSATNGTIVNLSFLPPDADNRGVQEFGAVIQPRSTVTFNDVVSGTLRTAGGGGIRIRSDRSILAASRTFNNATPALGTFGLSIPGSSLNAAATRGLLLFLSNQPGTPGYRSNIGFVNPSDAQLSVTYTLVNGDTGAAMGPSGSVTLLPYGFQQLNDIFSLVGHANSVTTNATIEFGATAPVLSFATVLDNISGDATYIAGQSDAGNPHPLGSSWGSSVQVSQTAGSSSGSVGRKVAVDSQGWMHVVWTEQQSFVYDIYYSRSLDGGKTWSQPLDIANSNGPAIGGNIAVGPDDSIHVAWNDRRDGGASRVYYARSRDRGVGWEQARDLSGLSSLEAAAPSLSVDSANRVHIAWHTGDPDSSTSIAQVYYTRSTNGGAGFEAARRLNSVTISHAAWPRFSVEGTNGQVVAVAWRDNRRNPDWDVYLAVSTDGGTSFTEKTGVATGNRDWDPDTLVDSNGTIHLTYTTYRVNAAPSVEYTRSTDRGVTWSPAQTVSEARSQLSSWVADRFRNILWLLWKDERDADPAPGTQSRADVALRYSLDGGRSWSAQEFASNEGEFDTRFPSMAIGPDGRIHVTWNDDRNGTSKQTVFLRSRASQVP